MDIKFWNWKIEAVVDYIIKHPTDLKKLELETLYKLEHTIIQAVTDKIHNVN